MLSENQTFLTIFPKKKPTFLLRHPFSITILQIISYILSAINSGHIMMIAPTLNSPEIAAANIEPEICATMLLPIVVFCAMITAYNSACLESIINELQLSRVIDTRTCKHTVPWILITITYAIVMLNVFNRTPYNLPTTILAIAYIIETAFIAIIARQCK